MAREGQGYPCYQHDMMMMMTSWLSRLWLKNTPTASLHWGKTLSPNECPRNDTKQADDAAPVMLELWRMQGNSLLPSIFTNPSARAGYDTRSIFKRSLTGLNSEFSFS